MISGCGWSCCRWWRGCWPPDPGSRCASLILLHDANINVAGASQEGEGGLDLAKTSSADYSQETLLFHNPQAQYMHLALALHQSALPWLRQRGATADAGRPLLAAVEAEVAEEEVSGGLAPAAGRRLRLAISRRALRLLLQLLRCVAVPAPHCTRASSQQHWHSAFKPPVCSLPTRLIPTPRYFETQGRPAPQQRRGACDRAARPRWAPAAVTPRGRRAGARGR